MYTFKAFDALGVLDPCTLLVAVTTDLRIGPTSTPIQFS